MTHHHAIVTVAGMAPASLCIGCLVAGQVLSPEATSTIAAAPYLSSGSTVQARLPTSASALGWDVGDWDVR